MTQLTDRGHFLWKRQHTELRGYNKGEALLWAGPSPHQRAGGIKLDLRAAMDYGAPPFPCLNGRESSHPAEWWGCGWQITRPFSSQVLVLRVVCSRGHTLEIKPRSLIPMCHLYLMKMVRPQPEPGPDCSWDLWGNGWGKGIFHMEGT